MNTNSLDSIALRHGTDKSSAHHNYTKIYEQYFEPVRDYPELVLIEAGFGGYNYIDRGGESAKTWRDYFSQAKIVITDIHPKKFIPDNTIFYQGSQDDAEFWNKVVSERGNPDIFIDDASHVSALCIETFKIMFPLLKAGGIYVVEDIHSSYWPDHGFGGGHHPDTTINFFKSLVDTLQAEHSGKPDIYGIASIHFWDKIIFILKK